MYLVLDNSQSTNKIIKTPELNCTLEIMLSVCYFRPFLGGQGGGGNVAKIKYYLVEDINHLFHRYFTFILFQNLIKQMYGSCSICQAPCYSLGIFGTRLKGPCFHRTPRPGIENKQVLSVLSDEKKVTRETTKNSNKNV